MIEFPPPRPQTDPWSVRPDASLNSHAFTGDQVARVVLVVSIVFACLIAVAAGGTVWLSRDRAIVHWRETTANYALMLSKFTEQTVNSGYLALDNVVDHIGARRIVDAATLRDQMSTRAVYHMLQDSVESLPQINLAAVVGDDGKVIAHSRSYPTPAIDFSDRDFFVAQKDDAAPDNMVSRPEFNAGNGGWTFYLSRRLLGRDGAFIGEVMLGISSHFYANFFGDMKLGPGITLVLLRSDLVQLARYPESPAMAETPAEGDVSAILAGGGGEPRFLSGPDGETRLGAARKVDSFPLVVGVIVSKDRVLGAWRKTATAISLGALGCIGLVAASARLLIGQLKRRENELRRKDAHIRYQELYDPLTGLPNRTWLHDRLQKILDAAAEANGEVAILLIDLDHFKLVNDNLGFEVGDALLRIVAERLRAGLTDQDILARLGGDEFVIVVPRDAAAVVSKALAEGIIARVAAPTRLQDHDLAIAASVGIALFPKDGSDVAALMRTADIAMDQAKLAGRNCVRFWNDSMEDHAFERLRLDAALRRAVDAKEFELHYQPKVNLDSGAIVGAEALVRWRLPDGQLVPPGEFIPLAEETGLICAIGDWCLEEVCRQLTEWRRRGVFRTSVAVNVSARQLTDAGFVERVRELVAAYGVSTRELEIEITESTIITDPDFTSRQIQLLRCMGIKVSVDDFGTGYSSLGYLTKLPVDIIKIDRSFVSAVDTDQAKAAMVAAIIGIGKALGFGTVAEGVETRAEADHLIAAGCHLAQGYLYSKPLPARQFTEWCERRSPQTAAASRGNDTPSWAARPMPQAGSGSLSLKAGSIASPGTR
jgi:diguanylate cyclase (GGDEF)-like protein